MTDLVLLTADLLKLTQNPYALEMLNTMLKYADEPDLLACNLEELHNFIKNCFYDF